ncbi:50S ribosomal protein L3 [Candidatus Parcubacteria bacterium]|jgi:large subunit ribosomal protein L3|nr:MAG: 50S ribosomal protein L3 [Candidatus Parcubacteria bacterium]
MAFILAKKIGVSQRFTANGSVVPVTLVQAGPCIVTQVKTSAKDGYDAVQVGFEEVRKPLAKAKAGHLRETKPLKHLKEFRVANSEEFTKGKVLDVTLFKPGEKVKITGVSKGKGFQGVVRRHHFGGGPASHGHKDNLRMPGSIGATFPQHVMKGLRMAGHMGSRKVSTRNLEIVEVEPNENLMAIKGAVPGVRNSLVMIQTL